MNPIAAFLKAIRWQNMAIIVLTMYLVREGIIYTYFNIMNATSQANFREGLTDLDFGILVISSVLIAAAGNLINDYFDLKIDRINKPDKIIVGRHIKRRVAMVLHVTFSTAGFLGAGYLAYKAGSVELAFVQAILIATLWFYSTDFKRRLIWGNIAVAFCIALIPLVVWIYEVMTMIYLNKSLFGEMKFRADFKQFTDLTLYWMLGLSVFFFLGSLAREITKDIVDMKGDASIRCKSMPIILGVNKTKWVLFAIYGIIVGLLVFVKESFLDNKITAIYFYLLLIPFFLATTFYTAKGKHSSDFRFPAKLNKWASVLGVLFLLVAYMELNDLWNIFQGS
jgi:4-hydroxybenzoate polyprenyltransferase